ncbi:MAG TPA: hypothetical protein VLK30_14845 [Candidatus Limnocylindrales bacterium]|nr:hypothetical protein [Candidatus Limnocylindrales bacterium]
MSSLEAVVRELRRSSSRSRAVGFLLHAVLASAGWVLLIVLAARLIPFEQRSTVAAAGVPVVFAALAVAWFVARPRPMMLMRTADVRLGLKERLSTAWERRLAAGPMDAALRRDALEQAARAKLAMAYPIGLKRGEMLVTGAIAITAIALVLLPNPMDQVLSQRRADRATQSSAAATVEAAKRKLAASASPAPVDPQVQKILQDAQAKIAAAPDPRTALQNITPAEQQLLQLADPQTPARTSSAQNLANQLSATSAGATAGRALNTSPAQGAQSLRNLASQLQGLSPQEQAELAKALAAAAQQSKDPAMASSLQQASSALASGNTSAAALALNNVAGQLDSLQQQQSNDQEIAAAINALEAARQQLAAQADRDAAQAAGTGSSASPGARSSPGSPGQGNGSGNGNGNQGSGNGNGSGTGNGNGGSGGTGGQGQSGSGAGAGSAAQGTERVYVPAPPAAGQQENDPTPLGPGQDVPTTPYGQVIQAYQQAALDAAQQSLIPGSEQDLIRAYFSSLGEPSGGR